MRRAERPIRQLPVSLLIGVMLILSVQMAFHHYREVSRKSSYRPLSSPLQASSYRGIAMGSEKLFGYLLAIRLQAHDNQAGMHFSYRRLDYHLLTNWLEQINRLDPATEYPMMLASRVYSQTRDKSQLAIILQYIERSFDVNPQLHWRRLAEASVIAKHQLGDLKLALGMAEKLASQPASVKMPNWARDIRFLLLAELNEYESAIVIIESLLQTDAVSDPDEKRFLLEKLSSFQQKLIESQQTRDN
jgi:hypothetical protein